MTDWARWITGAVEPRASDLVLKTCMGGPIRDFTVNWPNFMQQYLDPKLVSKARGAVSNKTPEKSTMFSFWASCYPLERKAGRSLFVRTTS